MTKCVDNIDPNKEHYESVVVTGKERYRRVLPCSCSEAEFSLSNKLDLFSSLLGFDCKPTYLCTAS